MAPYVRIYVPEGGPAAAREAVDHARRWAAGGCEEFWIRARDLRNPRVQQALRRRGIGSLPCLVVGGGRPVVGLAAIAAHCRRAAAPAPPGEVFADDDPFSYEEQLRAEMSALAEQHRRSAPGGQRRGAGGYGDDEDRRRSLQDERVPTARRGHLSDDTQAMDDADILGDYLSREIRAGGGDDLDLGE